MLRFVQDVGACWLLHGIKRIRTLVCCGRDERLRKLSGQIVLMLDHPQSKQVFHYGRWTLLYFSCACWLLSCHWVQLKRAWLYCLCTFPSGANKSSCEPHLLQANSPRFFIFQPVLIQEELQSLLHLCGPVLDLLQYVYVSPLLGSLELDAGLSRREGSPTSTWEHCS